MDIEDNAKNRFLLKNAYIDNIRSIIPSVFRGLLDILGILEQISAPNPNPNINDDITNVDAVIVVPPVKDIILNQHTSNIKKQKPAKKAIVAKNLYLFLPIFYFRFLYNYCIKIF